MSALTIPEEVKIWKIGPGPGTISSWNNYEDNNSAYLFCQANGKYLTYKRVPIGINLDFISSQEYKTHFRVPDGTDRVLLSGESVALGIGGGKAFLKYEHRSAGINLAWSQDPVFEWRLYGGEPGTPIQYDTPTAIANDKVKPEPDFLIHFNRPPGMADIGWTTSPGFWDTVTDVAQKQAIKLAKKTILGALA